MTDVTGCAVHEPRSLGRDDLERLSRPADATTVVRHRPSSDLPPEQTGQDSLRLPHAPRQGPPDRRTATDDRRERQPMIDADTGLANRLLLHDRLEHSLAERASRGGYVAAFSIVLNNLSYIHDQLGDSEANVAVREVSSRLHALLRSEDTIGRINLSELILAVSVQNPQTIKPLTERLAAAFSPAVSLSEQTVQLWATLGHVVAQDGETSEDLLARLERAPQDVVATRLGATGTG